MLSARLPGRLWPAVTLVFLLGCRRAPPAPLPAPPPSPPGGLLTTDGVIAVGNLQSEISGQERAMQQNPHPARLEALVALYTTRAQYLGRLADYDRAAELAERLVHEHPDE